MVTKPCGPIPGGLLLTHTQEAAPRSPPDVSQVLAQAQLKEAQLEGPGAVVCAVFGGDPEHLAGGF